MFPLGEDVSVLAGDDHQPRILDPSVRTVLGVIRLLILDLVPVVRLRLMQGGGLLKTHPLGCLDESQNRLSTGLRQPVAPLHQRGEFIRLNGVHKGCTLFVVRMRR